MTISAEHVSATAPAPSRAARIRRWYREQIRPTAQGLPNRRVFLAFPALVVIVGAVLIALGINGTSSGYFFPEVSSGSDPALIAGSPVATRSDEWNVQSVWALAQVQQGLPLTNESFPGGMDATIPQDLPRADWSVAFRPHLLGFLFLDPDHAMAWKWWLPGIGMLIAAYLFFASVLPRRPGVAAMLSVAFFFSPLIQWWYLSTTTWPMAWAFVTMAALVWSVRSDSLRSRWWWGLGVFYLTVVMATGIYVPFIVPAAWVVALFAVALFIRRVRAGERWIRALARFVPVLVAGVLGGLVTVLWLVQRWGTVEAFLNTAYPGVRLWPTGTGQLGGFLAAIGSSFTGALYAQAPGILGPNSSEASTFFYAGVFLLPVIVWIVVRQVRRRGTLPWELIALTASVALLLAYIYVPHWDALAHLLLLDKTTEGRVRFGVGIASIAMVVYVISYLDEQRVRVKAWLAALTGVLFVLSQGAVALLAYKTTPDVVLNTARWWWVVALLCGAVLFFFARRWIRTATAIFLAICLLGGAAVNPLYRGVFDLRKTPVSKAVVRLDRANDHPNWIGVGTGLTTAVLLESGVTAYNGFQGAPSRKMWDAIDPTHASEQLWNRLAGVNWTPGHGDPQVSNPAADQIMVTFDGCSTFAQENVSFVLSDDPAIGTDCLKTETAFSLPESTLTVYRVEPAK